MRYLSSQNACPVPTSIRNTVSQEDASSTQTHMSNVHVPLSRLSTIKSLLALFWLGACLSGATLIPAQPAQAAHWEVKEYLDNDNSQSQEWQFGYRGSQPDPNTGQIYYSPGCNKVNYVGNTHSHPGYESPYVPSQRVYDTLLGTDRYQEITGPEGFNIGFPTDFTQHHGFHVSWDGRNSPPGQVKGAPGNGGGKGDLALTPVLVWVQDGEDEEGSGSPEPPPKISYFVEHARIYGHEAYIPNDQGVLPPKSFTFSNVKSSFTTPKEFKVSGIFNNADGSFVTDYEVERTELYTLKNPDQLSVINGPTRYFSGSIFLNGSVFNEDNIGSNGSARVNFDYSFTPEPSCFTAGTLVSTEQGLRPIETLKQGEKVWSRDEQSGQTELKPIVRLFQHESPTTLVLTFSDGETVETTKTHPFYVEGKGFTAASQIGIGNCIVTRAGPSLKLAKSQLQDRPKTVYNFEVKDFHTYFVGKSELWVHNLCAFAPGFNKHLFTNGYRERGVVKGCHLMSRWQRWMDRIIADGGSCVLVISAPDANGNTYLKYRYRFRNSPRYGSKTVYDDTLFFSFPAYSIRSLIIRGLGNTNTLALANSDINITIDRIKWKIFFDNMGRVWNAYPEL